MRRSKTASEKKSEKRRSLVFSLSSFRKRQAEDLSSPIAASRGQVASLVLLAAVLLVAVLLVASVVLGGGGGVRVVVVGASVIGAV